MANQCYIEINIICLVLSSLVYIRHLHNRSTNSTSQLTMSRLIASLWVLCISDIIAFLCRGQFFSGARVLIEISNLLYIESSAFIAILWLYYVCIKTGRHIKKTHVFLISLPFIVITIIALLNPIIHLMFTIDDNNLYIRGSGIFLHWLISWFYIGFSAVIIIKSIRKSSNWIRRQEYKSLLYFIFLPTIAAILQIIFYGITTIQAGIAIALVLISMQMQDSQITVDELTQANNRKALRRYIDNNVHKSNPPNLAVIMIDINQFKNINDTLGHAIGDIALCDTANILKNVCKNSEKWLFLCRYGGDEFVIIGKELSMDFIQNLVHTIREDVANFSQTQEKPFTLDVSIGYVSGKCEDWEDFDHFLRVADEAMYDDKKRTKSVN